MVGLVIDTTRAQLLRCPFVRAVNEGRYGDAAALAERPPDPADPAVVAWLLAFARHALDEAPE